MSEDAARLNLDRHVATFLRKPPWEWQQRLAKNPGIDMAALTQDWNQILEAFARRNVVVHNQGYVDDEYRSRLSWLAEEARPPLGAILDTDARYFEQIHRAFSGLGNLLAVSWLDKFCDDPTEVISIAKERVYQSLGDRRWWDANAMGNIVRPYLHDTDDHLELQINLWMAQRELHLAWDETRKQVEARQFPPEHRFQLARAALLEDVPVVMSAFNRWLPEDPRQARQALNWPLIERLAEKSHEFAGWLRARQAHRTPRPAKRRRHR